MKRRDGDEEGWGGGEKEGGEMKGKGEGGRGEGKASKTRESEEKGRKQRTQERCSSPAIHMFILVQPVHPNATGFL